MAKVCLRGAFPAGTQVGIYERIGDSFSAALPRVKGARSSKESIVEIDGLDEGKPYFVAAEVDGEMRVRAVVAKRSEQVSAEPALKPPRTIGDGQVVHKVDADARKAAPSLRSQREDPVIVTGARSTRTRGHVPPADKLALEHDTETDQGRQDGIPPLGSKEEPKQLASDTFAGQAIEATPPGGRLQQDEVPKGTPQASSTEAGDAAVIVEVEEPPLGDHDPNRASGDSAVGPAGTVSPANQGDKSTSKIAREAEKSAARKPAGKRRLTKEQRARKAKRQRERAAEKKAAKAPGTLKPGTDPIADAGKDPAPDTSAARKPAPNRGERSTSRAKPATTKRGKARKSGGKQAVQREAAKQSAAKSRGRA